MEIDKTKKQKEVTRFMMKPQYGQYLGLIADETTDIEDEENVDEEGYKATIKQTIHGLVFTTETHVESEIGGFKTTEDSTMIAEIPSGTRLIWYPNKGYIIPRETFQTIDEVQQDFDAIKEVKLQDEENNKKIKE